MRALYLVVGVVLAIYVYLPETTPGRDAVRWFLIVGGIPAVTLSRVGMWKQAATGRLLTNRA